MPSPPRARLTLLAAAAAAAFACGDDPTPDALPVSRADSAGVEIVTTRIDAAAPICGPQGEPLRIGSVDGDERTSLFGVVGGVRLPDGRIAVAVDGVEVGITFFSPEGEWLRHVGRRGQGPGELKDLWNVWLRPPDTLVLLDLRPARVHFFHANGSWVRSTTLNPIVFERPEFAFPLASGSGFVSALQPTAFPQPPDPADRLATVARFDEAGAEVQRIGEFWLYRIVWLDPESRLAGQPMFGGRAAMIPLADGGLAHGVGVEPAVEILNADGTPRRVIRWEARDRTVRPADVDAYADFVRGRLDEAGLSRAQIEEAIRRETGVHRPVAEQFPGHHQMLSSPDGRLWVQEYPRPGDQGPDSWFVFEPDGTFVCRVPAPRRWTLKSVGPDHLVALTYDDLDVEYVVVQPIGPPGP